MYTVECFYGSVIVNAGCGLWTYKKGYNNDASY